METKEYYGGTYPTPPEIEEKTINAHICLSFDIEYDVPKSWSRDEIIDDIKENLNDFTWYNEEIEDIEV